MRKTVNKHKEPGLLYDVFALLLMLLFIFCFISTILFGIKRFMQPTEKEVIVD